MFDKAAAVLLKFAETEDKDENNDSIVNKLSQLFSLYLSGTQAAPERRQKFLKCLHYSDNKRHQEIAEKLFRSAFEAYHWSCFDGFSFGARKRDWGWQPQTNAEVKAWYEGFIDILKSGLESTKENIRNRNRSILSAYFRGLWSKAHCFETLDKIIKQQTAIEYWPEMWRSVKRTLHYDGEIHTPELLSLLKSLEKELAPSNFIQDLENHIFSNIHALTEHDEESYSESYAVISEKITKFGQIVATQPDTLEYLAPKLWCVDTDSIWLFGKGLAQGSIDKLKAFKSLISLMQKQKLTVVYPDLFAGFIKAVYLENRELAKQLQEQTLLIPELRLHFVYLLSTTPLDKWGASKLLEVANAGFLDASRFDRIGTGRIHETVTDDDLAAILNAVNKLDDGVFSVIAILGMRFFIDKNSTYVPTESLKKLGRKAISSLLSVDKDDISNHQTFGMDRIIEQCLTETAPKTEINEIIELLCEGIANYQLYRSDLTKIISALVNNFPELVLNRVFNGDDRQEYLASRLFRDNFSRHLSYLNDVPISRLLAWCNKDELRIQAVAKSISAFKHLPKDPDQDGKLREVTLTEHALVLLHVAKDKLAIANEIYEDICPNSWSGSRADIMEERAAAFSVLTDYSIPEIRQFAESKMFILNEAIREERKFDAHRFAEQEQRFE